MEILYRAKDGTVFKTAGECHDYEQKFCKPPVRLIGLKYDIRDDMSQVFMTEDSDDFAANVGAVMLRDDTEVTAFRDMCDSEGVSSTGIKGPGFYVWQDVDCSYTNEDEIAWIPIHVIADKARATLDRLTRYVQLMEEAGKV